MYFTCTRWFKYYRDKLWLVYTQIIPVIFEPPCIYKHVCFFFESASHRVRSVVQTGALINSPVIWYMTPCLAVKTYEIFTPPERRLFFKSHCVICQKTWIFPLPPHHSIYLLRSINLFSLWHNKVCIISLMYLIFQNMHEVQGGSNMTGTICV
jgi:hypothetical protein